MRRSGKGQRDGAQKGESTTYASAMRAGRPRRMASTCAIGHATVTQVSSVHDHHHPGASSATRTCASTKRLIDGSSAVYSTKKTRISRHVISRAAAEYSGAMTRSGERLLKSLTKGKESSEYTSVLRKTVK